MSEPEPTKTCFCCKFDIPVSASVCGYCRELQPLSSIPKAPEQIQLEAKTKRRLHIAAAAIIVSFGVTGLVTSVSDSVEKGKISAEVDRKTKIEQQACTEAANGILPGISRYADIMDGKIRTSAAERKREAASLRRLTETANHASATIDALGWGDLSTAKLWHQLSGMLITDAQVMESIYTKMKPSERSSSAQMHRKLYAVLKKHADEGFIHSASLDSDLYVPSETLSTSSLPAPAPAGSHFDFIRETSDLPSSAQRALDKIYKVDPARAQELSREAHEAGVQNLPNR